ncbi:MAG TPA: hypothetical protein VN620_11055, partial [Candidatus Methylomirabilis sp.]|nr:hypothetical protein [Candidatus Methylomirabilis sp.]
TPSRLLTHTSGKVGPCYRAAGAVSPLPFFRNAVVSDLLFAAAFFGIGYLVSHRQEEGVVVAR